MWRGVCVGRVALPAHFEHILGSSGSCACLGATGSSGACWATTHNGTSTRAGRVGGHAVSRPGRASAAGCGSERHRKTPSACGCFTGASIHGVRHQHHRAEQCKGCTWFSRE